MTPPVSVATPCKPAPQQPDAPGRDSASGKVSQPLRRTAPRLARRLLAVPGSLAWAVVGLSALAGVLLLGAAIEAWHDRQMAAELVYGAWWFLGLLAALALNVACAALKKLPWRRHQTGFLITHLGLLTLLSGGALTSLGGRQGVLLLVDSDEPRFRSSGWRSSDVALDRTAHTLWVRPEGQSVEQALFARLRPGPCRWGDASPGEARESRLLRGLAWLDHPWRRGWTGELADGAQLEVLTYLPQAIEEPFPVAPPSQPGTVLALRWQLASPEVGRLPPQWLADGAGERVVQVGPARAALVATGLSPPQVAEFLASANVDASSAAIEFAEGADGRLYFRAWEPGREAAVASGTLEAGGEPAMVWPSMGWTVRVLELRPHASAMSEFRPPRPDDTIPPAELRPALRCHLMRQGESADFWIGQTDVGAARVDVGGGAYLVGFNAALHDLGFEVSLDEAQPAIGGGEPSARVTLRDPADGQPTAATHELRFNQPVDYRGWTVYLSSVAQVGEDDRGRPVHRAVLLANRDPGSPLKHAGSALVVLGIACMFWMRAYFFRSRSREGQVSPARPAAPVEEAP
jgi:hypothetical protein